MFPDLFSIGPLTIHSYGLFVAIGFTVGILVTVRIGKAEGIKSQVVMDMGLVVILWAIIGSRLAYVLMNFSFYRTNPLNVFKVWEGGLVFSGGLIAVAVAMSWYLKRHHLSFWTMGDLWAPGIAIGQSIGRLGCFMAGCCYGKPTNLKWGVVFTHPSSLAPPNMSLHPTQLYASLSGLTIFVVLMVLHAKKHFEGQVFIWFLILHSTARLLIERFRGDNLGSVLGTEMSITQLISTLILIASVVALFVLKPKEETDLPDGRPSE
jgi:phosphatidylglycerol:prolipoprotein diacylglycerol transferase